MKKKNILILILILTYIIMPKSVFAYSRENYKYRSLCGNVELASFKSDGSINTISCHNNFWEARDAMKANGADDLAIMAYADGGVKIVDANVALLDLSVNPETLTYFYNNYNFTGNHYTYMDTGSLYGGVDGVLLDTAINNNGSYTAKVRIANYEGWIVSTTYEIVPITWVKSSSSYTITNDSIRHNYVAKIQDYYTGSAGSTIGPKPDMLNTGTYYSYDGHYFYKDLVTLIKDGKNGTYANSVNKDNPYYNYYMYLSNHTKSNYSSQNLDEFIRNNLNIKMDIYGDLSDGSTSRFYGAGTWFYYGQQKNGVNMLLAYSLSKNETGTGRSPLATQKNNGFGLNAVDSDPYHSARWYPTFSKSIMGYTSEWVTYGYAHPRDWRYFGPQFGNKLIGMNVQYASDTYWSEKMAANYYQVDRAKGLQDYNYYQLGVAKKGNVYTYQSPSTSSKAIYAYPEAEDAMVIVGETTGATVEGSNKWYEVVSDLNIDRNYNEITSGDYNWNMTVYIPAAYVKKINKPRDGYKRTDSVTDYQDSEYTYDLLIDGTTFKPKVALSTKDTDFYYDSALLSKKGQILKNNRYIMVHAICYDENGNVKSYLVTSDHMNNQKHWVDANSIRLVNKAYAFVNLYTADNVYTWVNSIPEDTKQTLISGLYINSYVPVLDTYTDGYNNVWYKVPVDVSGNQQEFGWTLKDAYQVELTLYGNVNQNTFPIITASNKEIVQGTEINLLDGVNATDVEDGNITNRVKVRSGSVNINEVGNYNIIYEVTDSEGLTSTKEITISVIKNELPVITAEDIEIYEGDKLVENYKATDKEDGDITNKVIKVKDTVDTSKAGEYEITYEVEDSYKQKTTKTIKVIVLEDEEPIITTKDIEIEINSTFKELDGVKAIDKEDGDITKDIKVIKNTVNTKELGEYEVTYEVVDSKNNKATITRIVTVVEEVKKVLEETEGLFNFYYLKENNNILNLVGYQTISGIDNTLDIDITYQIVFENMNNGLETIMKASRITSTPPKKVASIDGHDYTYSWFNANIDIDKLDNGNYKMYVIAKTDTLYSKSLISNKTYNQQVTDYKTKTTNAIISNNYSTKISFVELKIRDKELGNKTGSYVYNQYEKYTKFEVKDNKLHIRGNAYSYGMDLSNTNKVERTIIFENQSNYETYTKVLGSISDGNYKVFLPVDDNLDKTRAWYDANIDVSDIEEGKYIIYISTKSNISDISEMTEKLGRSLDEVIINTNNKKYTFTINKAQGNRIEMTVTK